MDRHSVSKRLVDVWPVRESCFLYPLRLAITPEDVGRIGFRAKGVTGRSGDNKVLPAVAPCAHGHAEAVVALSRSVEPYLLGPLAVRLAEDVGGTGRGSGNVAEGTQDDEAVGGSYRPAGGGEGVGAGADELGVFGDDGLRGSGRGEGEEEDGGSE